ncbi:MAG: HAMP domain-containing histidine kinase [Deltaproteobacteria bacterium]|nr:HAMP domain-containing histidine kinase [Deltaproteobacteria bacterium]
MGRQRNQAFNRTIAQYISSEVAKHAAITGALLFFISVMVFSASVKFSTDRYARGVCSEVLPSVRILVETSRLASFEPYYQDIVGKLIRQHELAALDVVKELPSYGWRHYSLGTCSLHWRSNFTAAFYSPTHWADATVYVRGIVRPRFIRSDLIMFMLAVCIVLVISYFISTRFLLGNIRRRISEPIHEIWEGLRSGKKPPNLELKEINDLWISLLEYKELLSVRNRMLITKAYYHEVKSPAFFQFNQLKRLAVEKDPAKQKRLISKTLKRADDLISKMEGALRKIANDDFAKHPKIIDLTNMIRQQDSRDHLPKVFIAGDETLIRTLLQNLYNNAIDACSDRTRIKTSLSVDSSEIILSIENPVDEGVEVDTSQIFKSGFTTKADGTGLGLCLCSYIVELHAGKIKAVFSREQRTFKIIVYFPQIEEPKRASAEQDAIPC